jgi:hypothetical protein
MTQQERELLRLMYDMRVEESKHQTQLIEDLSEAMDVHYKRMRAAIESVRKMQGAQNQMLKAIGDLMNLQED